MENSSLDLRRRLCRWTIVEIKKKSRCADCHEKGHWAGDEECKNHKKTSSKAMMVDGKEKVKNQLTVKKNKKEVMLDEVEAS